MTQRGVMTSPNVAVAGKVMINEMTRLKRYHGFFGFLHGMVQYCKVHTVLLHLFENTTQQLVIAAGTESLALDNNCNSRFTCTIYINSLKTCVILHVSLSEILHFSTCQMTLTDPVPDSVDGLKAQAEQDPD